MRAGNFPCTLDRVPSKALSMGHVEDLTRWAWDLGTFICQNNFTVSIAGSKQNSIWKPKRLPGGKSGSKVFTEMEGGCLWECTKTVALAKTQRGQIMSFRPDGLAVSLPAAAVIGKAPMALDDTLCKGWQRSLVRAPLLLLRPFRSSSGHRLMLLPPPSLSHPGRALGLLEAPSGDCLNIVLSRHRPRDPDA